MLWCCCPDTGAGLPFKLYNDAWLRENGFLDQLQYRPACATCDHHGFLEL